MPIRVLIYAINKHLRLWVSFPADGILKYFSYYSQETGFDSSCKLSPMETIGMKCQIHFSGTYIRKKSKCRLLNLPTE